MAGGWYFKLTFCFMVTTHEPLHLDKRSIVHWKIVDIPTSCIEIIIFFNRPFEYGDGGIFKLLRSMWNLQQSTWGHKILYADIFRGWTTFNKITFVRIQKYEHGWRFKVTIHILFYGENSWTVALSQSFVHLIMMDVTTSFIWIIIFFDGAFEYGGISKLWGYVGTNVEYFVWNSVILCSVVYL
jgi:hypothetical protein